MWLQYWMEACSTYIIIIVKKSTLDNTPGTSPVIDQSTSDVPLSSSLSSKLEIFTYVNRKKKNVCAFFQMHIENLAQKVWFLKKFLLKKHFFGLPKYA